MVEPRTRGLKLKSSSSAMLLERLADGEIDAETDGEMGGDAGDGGDMVEGRCESWRSLEAFS